MTRAHSGGRRTGVLGAGLLLLVLAAASPAAAQVSFGLGIHGGVVSASDADNTVPTGGAHARLRLLGFLGLEGAVDYRQEEFSGGLLQVDTVPITLSVLLYPIPVGPLQPYLVGGIGFYLSDITVADGPSNDTSNVGAHLGGGLDIRLGSSWALHGDVRYVIRELDTNGLGVSSLDADGWQVQVGLTYYFW